MHRWSPFSVLFGLNLFLGLTAVGGGVGHPRRVDQCSAQLAGR